MQDGAPDLGNLLISQAAHHPHGKQKITEQTAH
jgi:hypothetical protein